MYAIVRKGDTTSTYSTHSNYQDARRELILLAQLMRESGVVIPMQTGDYFRTGINHYGIVQSIG